MGFFVGILLVYFGVEVIKVELFGGDLICGWCILDDIGILFWWCSLGCNKCLVILDLKSDVGCELVVCLIDDSDVLIENFCFGILENWGLGLECFKESNFGLVYMCIFGYG